ncbi:transposase [Streptomyces sp. NPDC059743]|uniref:transposase n=1 Tax=Streptomyces sp. NPDC059743 TaxID=3346928 RepID=UPI00364E31D6
MTRQRPYPSDLSDARWELIGFTLTAWRAERRGKGLDAGRLPEHDLRRTMGVILHVGRTDIPWRYLPHHFPPRETVYGYFAAWQKEGVFDQLDGLLRRLVREAEGRDGEPTACVLDAQSVKTSANVPAADQGIDAGKKTAGRKRHLGGDNPRPAPGRPGHQGERLRQRRRHAHRRHQPSRDQGMDRHRLPHQGHRPQCPPRQRRRSCSTRSQSWVVERTFGWLMHRRRLARDYETHPHRSEVIIHVAMIDLISRRLTREFITNWHDT